MKMRFAAILVLIFTIMLTLPAEADNGVFILPENTVIVEPEAFAGVTGIHTLLLPEGIERIESRAFSECEIDGVNLPLSLIYIADDAFKQIIHATVVEGSYAHSWCIENNVEFTLLDKETPAEHFTHVPIDDTHTCITGYSGDFANVVIPETLEGYIVQEIGTRAFEDCKGLTSIEIPNTVTCIREMAFSGCDGLTFISLPDSITTLEGHAFSNCVNLSNINIPLNWKDSNEIYSPFEGCTKLSSIQIPDGMTEIPSRAFQDCEGLTSIEIPNTVTCIREMAFNGCTGLASVVLPDSISTLEGHAFRNCSNLASVNIPLNWTDSFEMSSPFEGCSKLTSISFPEGMTTIPSRAFSECTNLKNVIFPSTLIDIGYSAFSYCSNLTDVKLPDGLELIDECAFLGCNGITIVDIPDSVTTIGTRAFSESANIEHVDLPLSWITVKTGNGYCSPFAYCPNLTSIEVPEGMTSLPELAFDECSSLINVTMPSTLKSIGYCAFYGCNNLIDIVFPDGLLAIGSSAFAECTSLTSVTLPESVTTLGYCAFSYCDNLELVKVSSNWTTVDTDGGYCSPFAHCPKLTSIQLPDGMTAVPAHAFSKCENLQRVQFSSTITTIGMCAFYECSTLESPVFPSCLESIGSAAFYECDNLLSIELPQALQRIGSSAFAGCDGLTEVEIPDSVTTMGYSTFSECENLESVKLPLNWTTVDTNGGYRSPFAHCPKLTSIEVPEGMQKLPAGAFDHCESLTRITLPSTLTNIGYCAFYYCSSLPEIYIPSAVKEIGDSAFAECSALTIESEYGSAAIAHARENGIPYYYLSLTGATKPTGKLYRGDTFTVKGYVRSTLPLTQVLATIYNADKTEILYQADIAPEDETDFNLNSYLNSVLRFSELALGSYCFELKASTERSEEVFLDTAFTIVPPPLRVTLSNEVSPSGLQSIGGALSIGGTIRSNYLITSVSVEIRSTADNSLITKQSAAPDTYTYSVSSLSNSLNAVSLASGDYVYILRIVSNTETRRLVYSEFSMRAYDAAVPEDTYNAVYSYVTSHNGQEFWDFIGTHMMKKYCEIESAGSYLVLSWSKYHEAVISYFKNYFAADQGAEFRKNLYKQQLLKLIEDTADSASASTDTIKAAELIRDSLLKYGKIKTTDILEEGVKLTESMKDYIKTFNKCLDKMGDLIDAVEFTEETAAIFAEQTKNYEAEIQFIDSLSASFSDASSDEKELYLTALSEIKAEYQSRTYKALSKLYDKLTSEMVKAGTSAITSYFCKVVGGTSTAYSVTTLAIDLLAELGGINDAADELVEFITLCECALAANDTYTDAHSVVWQAIANDVAPTTEQVNKLIVSFDVVKSCTVRLIEHMIKTADSSAEANTYHQELIRITNITILPD